jgi:hypothetical protein
MTEQQFNDDYEATDADAAEQSLPVDQQEEDPEEVTGAPAEPEAAEAPLEADPADAAEQAVAVPMDEDEYR